MFACGHDGGFFSFFSSKFFCQINDLIFTVLIPACAGMTSEFLNIKTRITCYRYGKITKKQLPNLNGGLF